MAQNINALIKENENKSIWIATLRHKAEAQAQVLQQDQLGQEDIAGVFKHSVQFYFYLVTLDCASVTSPSSLFLRLLFGLSDVTLRLLCDVRVFFLVDSHLNVEKISIPSLLVKNCGFKHGLPKSKINSCLLQCSAWHIPAGAMTWRF